MRRTYGTIARSNGAWVIDALEPHVVIKLKQLFAQLPKHRAAPFSFAETPKIAADLQWFVQRYPLAGGPDDLIELNRQALAFHRGQDEIAGLMSADYTPPTYVGLQPGQTIRAYQAQPVEVLNRTGGLLVGDEVGLGKTYLASWACLAPGALPAVVVCHAHLQRQWCEVIERFTTLKAHAIRGTRPYAVPSADVRVFRYSQVLGWCDVLGLLGCGLVVFDEVQELRTGLDSGKGQACRRLADVAGRRLGLSATPIYNYGREVWQVMRFVRPDVLGDYDDFAREWCSGGMVEDPKALGTYLREQHAFIRRTKSEVGQQMPPVNRIVDVIEHDALALRSIDDLAHDLAVRATSGDNLQRGEATRMLDLRVRHATGVAKAKMVAAMVRIMVEGGTPVVLVGWHRQVYDIWLRELEDLNPALYTGSESAAGKNSSKERFVAGETDILIMSLRSGAGLDGLQARCSTMVFGELDWSPGIHHQCIGRLDREGQAEPVTAIFLVCDDGSDPAMMEVLGLKASQAASIVDPHLGVQRVHSDQAGLKRLVAKYLARKSLANDRAMPFAALPEPEVDDGGEAAA